MPEPPDVPPWFDLDLVDIEHKVCGGIAFRYTEMPEWGDVIDASKGRLLDGTIPTNGDRLFCGSCGREAWIGDLRPVGSDW